MEDGQQLGLRERKQRQAKERIVASAMTLFAEYGFDGVTVAQIAEHAEVGRTTFFRYFADKQELLFADDAELLEVLTSAIDKTLEEVGPVGDSLGRALAAARTALRAVAEVVVRESDWLALRERLIQQTPALLARNLLKLHRYAQASVDVLVRRGADLETATLAAGIAAACYTAAHATTLDAPERLPEAIDAAFERLARLGPT